MAFYPLFARLLLALALALADDGAGLDPHGGEAMDPNGGATASSLRCAGDYTGCIDPNG